MLGPTNWSVVSQSLYFLTAFLCSEPTCYKHNKNWLLVLSCMQTVADVCAVSVCVCLCVCVSVCVCVIDMWSVCHISVSNPSPESVKSVQNTSLVCGHRFVMNSKTFGSESRNASATKGK